MMATAAHGATLTPDLHAQKAPVTLRTGDFDGDGRVDTLYLVDEADTGRVAVHVRLDTASGPKDIRVTSLDTGSAAAPDLRVVPAGSYAADCGSYATGCTSAPVEASHDSIMVAIDGTTTVLAHWQGDHFEQDFVKNADSLLAHAVAALYAVNP